MRTDCCQGVLLFAVAVSCQYMFVGCLTAELNNSILLRDGKFSKRLTVSTREDRFVRTAFGCNFTGECLGGVTALIQPEFIHTVNLSSFHVTAKYVLTYDKRDCVTDFVHFKVCL